MRKNLFIILMSLLAMTGNVMAQQERVSIDNVSVETGGEAVFDIRYQLPSTGTYVGFMFQVSLPEGLSLAEDADDPGYPWYDDTVAAISKLNITTTAGYGFAATPKKASSTITGTNGVLMRLKLKADVNMPAGTYTGKLTDVSFNLRDDSYNVTKSKLDDVTFNITVGGIDDEWLKCDVNGDGKVDVADIATIIRVMAKRMKD